MGERGRGREVGSEQPGRGYKGVGGERRGGGGKGGAALGRGGGGGRKGGEGKGEGLPGCTSLPVESTSFKLFIHMTHGLGFRDLPASGMRWPRHQHRGFRALYMVPDLANSACPLCQAPPRAPQPRPYLSRTAVWPLTDRSVSWGSAAAAVGSSWSSSNSPGVPPVRAVMSTTSKRGSAGSCVADGEGQGDAVSRRGEVQG